MKFNLKTADKYIIKSMLGPIIFGVAIFACLFLIETLIQQMDDLVQKQIHIFLIIKLLAYLLPTTLIMTIPMGVLMGTMIAFGNLSASSEITAFEAAGVSVRRLTRTALIVGFVIFLFVLMIEQFVVPDTREKMMNVTKQMIFSRPTMMIEPGKFIQDIPSFSIYVKSLDKKSDVAKDVVFFQKMQGDFPAVTIGKEMRLTKSMISLNQGKMYQLDKDGFVNIFGTFEEQNIPTDSFSADLNSTDVDDNSFYSLSELKKRIDFENRTKGDSVPDKIMLHQKIAIAFSPIILVFLGTLLSIKNKRSGKGVSFGLSIMLIFVFIAMIQVGTMLAINRVLSPFVAMWYPNIILIFVSIGLFIKQKRSR